MKKLLEKRAMIEVLVDVFESLDSQKKGLQESIEYDKTKIETESYSYTFEKEAIQNGIRDYESKITAIDTIITTLEKLI